MYDVGDCLVFGLSRAPHFRDHCLRRWECLQRPGQKKSSVFRQRLMREQNYFLMKIQCQALCPQVLLPPVQMNRDEMRQQVCALAGWVGVLALTTGFLARWTCRVEAAGSPASVSWAVDHKQYIVSIHWPRGNTQFWLPELKGEFCSFFPLVIFI